MKSKAPLVMMEQIVMVLIFALAAALCLQTFVLSGRISKKTDAQNHAVLEVQNMAELMKMGGFNAFAEAYGGQKSGELWKCFYTEDWNLTKEEAEAEYIVEVSFSEARENALWRAEIVMNGADGNELIRVPVAGQTEVMQNE